MNQIELCYYLFMTKNKTKNTTTIRRREHYSNSDLMIVRRAQLDVLRRLLDDRQRCMGYESIDEQVKVLKFMLALTKEITNRIQEAEKKGITEMLQKEI